jgi:putative hydrolases of HD superfamily
MRTKAPMATPPAASSPLVRAYFEIQHLKQLFRQGWLRRGVDEARAESVADHTFGTATMAMLLADALRPELDVERVLRLALIHDLGEAYAGDITPADGVASAEKQTRERTAVQRIVDKLPGGDRYRVLWEEYETAASPEARFVRRVDRLEMALQASVYRAQGCEGLDEFLASARADIAGSELESLLDELDGPAAPVR